MQIISSYGVELRKQNIPICQILEIYRSAVSYLIGIYVQVWDCLLYTSKGYSNSDMRIWSMDFDFYKSGSLYHIEFCRNYYPVSYTHLDVYKRQLLTHRTASVTAGVIVD